MSKIENPFKGLSYLFTKGNEGIRAQWQRINALMEYSYTSETIKNYKRDNEITDLLENVVDAVSTTKFEIVQFNLGDKAMENLKQEVKKSFTGFTVDIKQLNHFQGIPIYPLTNKDTEVITFSICPKDKK